MCFHCPRPSLSLTLFETSATTKMIKVLSKKTQLHILHISLSHEWAPLNSSRPLDSFDSWHECLVMEKEYIFMDLLPYDPASVKSALYRIWKGSSVEGIISVSKSFDDPAGNGWIESDISERRPKRLEKKTDCKMRLILTQMDKITFISKSFPFLWIW